MQVEWRTISEFPIYEINQLGDVRNRETKVLLIQQRSGTSNTFVVMLFKDGKTFGRSVRKLMRSIFPSEG